MPDSNDVKKMMERWQAELVEMCPGATYFNEVTLPVDPEDEHDARVCITNYTSGQQAAMHMDGLKSLGGESAMLLRYATK